MSTSETKVSITNVATGISPETAMMTTDVVPYSQPAGEGIIIRGIMNITAGTGATGITIKCRRGANTTTGALVGPSPGLPHTLAAGASACIAFEFLDPTPTVTPLSTPTGAAPAPLNVYSLTVTQTGAPSAAGTVNYGTAGIETASVGV